MTVAQFGFLALIFGNR